MEGQQPSLEGYFQKSGEGLDLDSFLRPEDISHKPNLAGFIYGGDRELRLIIRSLPTDERQKTLNQYNSGSREIAKNYLRTNIESLSNSEDRSQRVCLRTALSGDTQTLSVLLEDIDDPKINRVLRVVNHLVNAGALYELHEESVLQLASILQDNQDVARRVLSPQFMMSQRQIADHLTAAATLLMRDIMPDLDKHTEEFIANLPK